MCAINIQQDRLECLSESFNKAILFVQNKELSHLLGKQGEQMSNIQADLRIHHKSMALTML